MDSGDLDGDGREELLLLAEGTLALYRFDTDHFQHIVDYPLPNHLALHKIFLADLDRNNQLEIYIGASHGDIPASLILSWDGSRFMLLNQNIPYYLRPDTNSAGNQILLGQMGNIQADAHFSPIYRIIIHQDGRLERREEVAMPRGLNIYDFIRADLDQNGSREVIGITPDNKLVVFNQAGTLLWKSEETYGAGRDIFGTLTSNKEANDERAGERIRNYIHTRIIAQDQTGDGRPEIIIGRNRVTNVKFFKNLRYFEGSSLAALRWDGSQLNTLWETREIPGYTVDYQILQQASSPDQFRLFFVESDDSGIPLSFWSADDTRMHLYGMGKVGRGEQ
ncbi:MAG: VCBS repeat-containing protein [Candidatus Electrothrix sp. AR3]|nr:VCBS repeat-containing protein [Candidatus Electrothrix sp. AR3]